MPATFELKCNDDDLFYFEFVSSNDELLLMSGAYEVKQDAEQAIKDVQLGSMVSEQIAAGQTKEGGNFFIIKDSGGDVLVKSILFDSRMLFDNALHAVRDNACIAEIRDLT